MESTELDEWCIQDLCFLVLVLVLLRRIIFFINCLSLDAKDSDEALLSSHNDLFILSGIVHECNRLRRDLSSGISICGELGGLETVFLVHVLSHGDVVVLVGITCLEVNLRHLCAVPLDLPIFHRYDHMLLGKQEGQRAGWETNLGLFPACLAIDLEKHG